MAKKTLNLVGNSEEVYDLDKISENTRDNSDLPLVLQVHKYRVGEDPNPSNLKIGQIWLSKREV